MWVLGVFDLGLIARVTANGGGTQRLVGVFWRDRSLLAVAVIRGLAGRDTAVL
jgi:hypothetical protein